MGSFSVLFLFTNEDPLLFLKFYSSRLVLVSLYRLCFFFMEIFYCYYYYHQNNDDDYYHHYFVFSSEITQCNTSLDNLSATYRSKILTDFFDVIVSCLSMGFPFSLFFFRKVSFSLILQSGILLSLNRDDYDFINGSRKVRSLLFKVRNSLSAFNLLNSRQ